MEDTERVMTREVTKILKRLKQREGRGVRMGEEANEG